MVDQDHFVAIKRAEISHGALKALRSRTGHLNTRHGECREGQARTEGKQGCPLVVSVSPANSRGHVVVSHRLLVDEAVGIHRDGQLAPSVLLAEEAGRKRPSARRRRVEGLNDGVGSRAAPVHQGVDCERAPIGEHQHHWLVQGEDAQGEGLLQSGQGGVSAVQSFVLDVPVDAEHQHHDVGARRSIQGRLLARRHVAADVDALLHDGGSTDVHCLDSLGDGVDAAVAAVDTDVVYGVVRQQPEARHRLWTEDGNAPAGHERQCAVVLQQDKALQGSLVGHLLVA
mmetsp:Transcript_47316/g.133083  ORF Transcript_47316/g.133083 Transcript_47316/m.133083 type:complete len:285 (-) Transcript_47316:314-1168(-)